MKFTDIVLGEYLVSANKSFLYFVYEKDYQKKSIKIEVLDASRPLLKFSNEFRFKEFKDFSIFENYKKPIKIKEKMNRETLEAKILETLTEFNLNNGKISQNESEHITDIIMSIIPKTSLEQVEEFMITGNQPTNIALGEISLKRRLFRHQLIQEETNELLDALSFVERIDAYIDLQYVLDGAIIEEGFKDLKDELFAEVHRSNMTKFDNTEEEAIKTQIKYLSAQESIETYYSLINDKYVTFRSSDDKVLKSINYSEPNLKQFIE